METSLQEYDRQVLAEAEAAVRWEFGRGEGDIRPFFLLESLRRVGGVPLWAARSAVLRMLERGELVWERSRYLRLVPTEGRAHDE